MAALWSWGGAFRRAGRAWDVELTVQDGRLHVWLGLDTVVVRAACDDFARLLSHTLPYTDCLGGDDHRSGRRRDVEKLWYAEPTGPGNVLLMFFQTPIYE
ncbi:hypothetical protein ACFQ6Q_36805 [Streptomyces sp. NPDC056437]|uniref:hypothetical protein n=1 Tax=Streptomyces sp. NPDC056437 TaxID=3345816 RepID=UPI0036B2ADA3